MNKALGARRVRYCFFQLAGMPLHIGGSHGHSRQQGLHSAAGPLDNLFKASHLGGRFVCLQDVVTFSVSGESRSEGQGH